VGLDETNDDVRTALAAPPSFVEHSKRLTDAGSQAQVDAKGAS
jgi:hypothetical protein